MFDLVKGPEEKVRILGHRGAMGHAPENTMASFRLGRELGADMIELDVHLSRDRVPVVIHDENLARTTNGKGDVNELTLAQLQRLDAGSRHSPEFAGERIPSLDEVLAWAKGKIPVNIEIKNGPRFYRGIERLVLEAVARHGALDEVVVSSFDHLCLQAIKKMEPRIRTGILYSSRFWDPVGYARRLGADAFHPRWNYVTAEFVREAHEAGLAVNSWVANSPALMETLIELGVDMIGTNYPDRLKAAAS